MPSKIHLPFFAYGVFKPGELAFLQVKDLVASIQACSIGATLRIRDGLPIASLSSDSDLPGSLIHFKPGSEEEAYRRISEFEPQTQYRWTIVKTNLGDSNSLVGRSPLKGSVIPDDNVWKGRDDPLFTVALSVVEETLIENQCFDWNLKPLFRLEMAYLLLWTAIERYASLRYHLADDANQKVMKIANEEAFQVALEKHVTDKRKVCRSDDPQKKIALERNAPNKALAYYYQIRSNLVHRGKGVPHDHERLAKSLSELLAIFRIMLESAFQESELAVSTSNRP
jgi:hypothetical protein